MTRRIAESVVVITGASSGIGRATAEAFARRGASLVLAARREQGLQQAAEACREHGAEVFVAPTDVTDEDAVDRLAQEAVDHFGRIDVWVNNAAVTLFARFEEAPSDVYRKVFETNVFGYVNGARAALRCFREQGAGVLINVSSVVASAAQPYTSAYCASKAAIRSLSDCLRMELQLDQPHEIYVSTVMPASIDTPFFQHGANYTGRKAKALDPVNPPEVVAEAIVQLARNPKREKLVGKASGQMWLESVVAPGFHEWFGAGFIDRNHLQDQPEDPTHGNVMEPMTQYTDATGGWQHGNAGGWKKAALAGLALAATAWLCFGGRRDWERLREQLPSSDDWKEASRKSWEAGRKPLEAARQAWHSYVP